MTSEISELEEILAAIPQENVIERLAFEDRLASVEKKMNAIQAADRLHNFNKSQVINYAAWARSMRAAGEPFWLAYVIIFGAQVALRRGVIP